WRTFLLPMYDEKSIREEYKKVLDANDAAQKALADKLGQLGQANQGIDLFSLLSHSGKWLQETPLQKLLNKPADWFTGGLSWVNDAIPNQWDWFMFKTRLQNEQSKQAEKFKSPYDAALSEIGLLGGVAGNLTGEEKETASLKILKRFAGEMGI